ncbi:hypothetical protein T439DRAFT_360608 [Meredithblackwellia eburnea MCA 4105]
MLVTRTVLALALVSSVFAGAQTGGGNQNQGSGGQNQGSGSQNQGGGNQNQGDSGGSDASSGGNNPATYTYDDSSYNAPLNATAWQISAENGTGWFFETPKDHNMTLCQPMTLTWRGLTNVSKPIRFQNQSGWFPYYLTSAPTNETQGNITFTPQWPLADGQVLRLQIGSGDPSAWYQTDFFNVVGAQGLDANCTSLPASNPESSSSDSPQGNPSAVVTTVTVTAGAPGATPSTSGNNTPDSSSTSNSNSDNGGNAPETGDDTNGNSNGNSSDSSSSDSSQGANNSDNFSSDSSQGNASQIVTVTVTAEAAGATGGSTANNGNSANSGNNQRFARRSFQKRHPVHGHPSAVPY